MALKEKPQEDLTKCQIGTLKEIKLVNARLLSIESRLPGGPAVMKRPVIRQVNPEYSSSFMDSVRTGQHARKR